MPAGAEDTGDHLLGVRAARRPVAAADFARHDRGPNRLLRLPIGGFDVRMPQAGEERRPLGAQMLEEAAVRRVRDAAREEAIGASLEPADGDGEPVANELARIPPFPDRECREQQAADGMGEARCAPLRDVE